MPSYAALWWALAGLEERVARRSLEELVQVWPSWPRGLAQPACHIPQDVHNYGETQQWWLMSSPGHSVWDKVLAAVCDNTEK